MGFTQIARVLQEAWNLIREEIVQGNEIALRRFGSFEIRLRKSKIGRNPNKKGSEIVIPPRRVVRFSAGLDLKKQVGALPPPLGS